MGKGNIKFLLKGFGCMMVVSAVVFITLIFYLGEKTDKSIVEISDIYMSEMGMQIQQKFDAIISLRMEQVEGLISGTQPKADEYSEEMLEDLKEKGELRKFTYLGFYTREGILETIYGEPVSITDEEYFEEALYKNGRVVARGMDGEENKILLLGIQADYPMEDGSSSFGLIAGISMEYLDSVLFRNTEGANMYFHIIDEKGKFVIRNSDVFKENYFERIMEKKEIYDSKTAESYIGELKEAIEQKKTYNTIMSADGRRMHIHGISLLINSQWYLIMVMPDDVLEAPIVKLDALRIKGMVVSLAIIVLGLTVLVIQYVRISRRQMRELDKARKEAVYANQSKSEFLSSMSHDIRTPMNAIIGMTEIALKNREDEERVVDCLQKVKLSSRHLLGLINDVLDISKIESGKMTLNIREVSLRYMADDIVNIIYPQIRSRKQHFDVFINNILSESIYCDDVQLNQVLLNLLSNALKFTPEEGRINVYISQENSPVGDEYVRTHFKVEDNGMGMSKEFQEKIFDSFTRDEAAEIQHITGTGLGMAITKNIVDMMDGTIEVKSELQKGSRFHITLDFKRGADKEAVKLPKWNVLVLDDNEDLCTVAAENLEAIGMHADWTPDSDKAVEMIVEKYNKNEGYDFVLIDWKQLRMDENRVIRKVREKVKGKKPVFVVSTYSWSDIEEEINKEEVGGYIEKPLFRSTLFTKLRQFTEKGKKEEKQKRQEINFEGKRLLVAEDNELNWEIAYEVLAAVGFEVEHAVDGKDCLEKFEKSQPGYYDAVLMDIRMPIMNGYDATKAIRALEREDKGLPIIAMTADAFTDDIQDCLESGMNAHTAKPIDVGELMQLLQEFMNA